MAVTEGSSTKNIPYSTSPRMDLCLASIHLMGWLAAGYVLFNRLCLKKKQ